MNCERIRELLLTDYSDGELPADAVEQVNNHLATCQECRAFQAAAAQRATSPFQDEKEIQPPLGLWQKIQETIDLLEHPQERFNLLEAIKERSFRFFIFPRPAYALATVATIALVLISLLPNQAIKRATQIEEYLNEHGEFVTCLETEFDYNVFGGTIEDLVQ